MTDETESQPCRLVELRATNFLRLNAIEIRPDSQVVEITGANGEGKTSVLRAFWSALKGKAALTGIAPVAIHQGAEGPSGDAALYLDLGRVKITRTITRGENGEEGWTLKLASGDRRITSRPQAMLDAIVGDGLALDPLEFTRWDALKQFDALRSLVPGFDFAQAAQQDEGLRAERTDVNREAKRARAAAESIVLPEGPEPEPVDIRDAAAQLEAAVARNRETEQRQTRRKVLAEESGRKRDEGEQLRLRAAALEREATTIDERLAAAETLPAIIDTTAIAQTIATAEETGAVRGLFAARRRHLKEAEGREQEAEDLTERIELIAANKAAAIARADLPVDGLSLGDGVVLLNGLPFSQASMAEKIKASMAIAMATAGDLHVVMIDEGSELDSKSLAIIEGLVEGTDFIVMICRVDESGERGWVIEDGRVARAPTKEKRNAKPR